jgi:anti-sigma regulatory factor (Ser/Thr protein kinase)
MMARGGQGQGEHDQGRIVATLRVTSTIADLARLYPWLDHAATGVVPAALLPKLHVVVEEAVANVAMHAFPQDEVGEITVQLRVEPDATVLTVEDAGAAFDSTAAAEPDRPTSLLDATPGGLGLRLMRRYCSDITYERRDGRNRLTLRFPTESGGPADGSARGR